MKIDHISGTSVETNNLPDADAILMEESKKLHELFIKYNRQVILVGEMMAKEGLSSTNGCVFYHVGNSELRKTPELFQAAVNSFYGRLDGFVRSLTRNTLGIGHIPPPQVKS